MKVLITGANGFVGKNLRSELTLHKVVMHEPLGFHDYNNLQMNAFV